MKKLFLIGCLGILILACSKKENVSTDISSLENSIISDPSKTHISGKEIIETFDCSGCHAVNERMIGPSYQEIADKYSEKEVEILASKIIEGGSGVWGSVPMHAHSQVSKEDAKKMVEYILTLKK